MQELVKKIAEQNKSEELRIVPMQKNDVEAVKKLETRCNLSPWSVENYKAELNRNDSLAVVAKIGSEVVGFTIARLITNSNNEKPSQLLKEIEIYNIAVNPTTQNSGVGQSLLAHLLSEATVRGTTKIWLEVRESNDVAVRFYKKNGFAEVYTRKNFYSSPSENAIVMMLEISIPRRE